MKQLVVIFLMCLGTVHYANAQSISLLIDEAFKNHHKILSLKYAIEEAKKNTDAAKGFPVPKFRASIGNISAISMDDPMGQRIPTTLNFMLSQEIPILKNFYQSEIEASKEKVALLSLEQYQIELTEQIVDAYYSLWQYQTMITYHHQIHQLFEKMIDDLNNSVMAGSIRLNEQLLIKAEKMEHQSEINSIFTLEKSTTAALNILLGREDITSKIEIDTLDIQNYLNETLLMNQRIDESVLYRQAEAFINVEKMKNKKAKSMLVPDIMFDVEVSKMPFITSNSLSSFMTSSKNMLYTTDWMVGVGVSITLPFFPSTVFSIADEIQASQMAIQSMEYNVRDMKLNLQKNIQTEFYNLEIIKDKINVLEKSVIPIYTEVLHRSMIDIRTTSSSVQIFLNTANAVLNKNDRLIELKTIYYKTLNKIKQIKK